MNDLISIIIPIYNSEKSLRKCIESVINQTYRNIEIILVNDGSTDSSQKIIEEYKKKDDRIVCITKENSGVSDSRNVGIENSNGKYISFVDSDDFIENMMIEELYKCLIDKDVDAVRCKACIDNGKSLEIENFYNLDNKKINSLEIKDNLYHFIIDKESINCFVYTLLIKKDKIVSFNSKFFFMEDKDFYVRLLLNLNSIYFLNKSLYYYSYNEKSLSKDVNNCEKNIFAILDVTNSIKDLLTSKNILNEKYLKDINNNIFNLIFFELKIFSRVQKKSYKFIKFVFEDTRIISIIKEIDKNSLSITKKVEYFLIKNKLYRVLSLLVKLTSLK